ncbi:hypothetical protein Pla123a_31910 [Posidoniimonas polymericola]|uniref:PEP-CTERM protein-sorting domain-containing protein n=1 Tax=Posidoniimonas polymericola TaxID=2528002 RepID=A0A5C5YLB9_9BACT|nr:hypothetical protein [Posidoniimonas polymericola]TWT75681.1 hypothetical protein Pla123a_31910 [Posidoniimonas polymericola]
MKKLRLLAAGALLASPASAAITVDGTVDGGYGGPLAVQSVETNFGDSAGGNSGGGELDAGYATVQGGRLYVTLTGNIEPNFNKVSVFIDSKAGGENTLSGTPAYDSGNVSQNFGGLTFDAGFEADYHLFGRWGGGAFEVDFIDRAGGTSATVNGNGAAAAVGAGTPVQSGVVTPGDISLNAVGSALTQDLQFAFNNSNAAGVLGGTAAADPVAAAAVTTGLEFSIALADLGNPAPGSEILIHAAYGNGDNNYHSNQVLGGLAGGTGNLGGDGGGTFTGSLSGIDFNQFAGDQYFSVRVVPEPCALTLAVMAFALPLARCRRS